MKVILNLAIIFLIVILETVNTIQGLSVCDNLSRTKCYTRKLSCVWNLRLRRCTPKTTIVRSTTSPTTSIPTTAYPSNVLCTNDCPWAKDGSCDDGGPNSIYNICEFGTDCKDCGERKTETTDEISGDSGLNIDLRFVEPPIGGEIISDDIKDVFIKAKKRLEEIIVGDLGPNMMKVDSGKYICGNGYAGTRVQETTYWDDILIFIEIKKIDGLGNILGGAGPCVFDTRKFPRAGYMRFDSDDIKSLFEEDNGKPLLSTVLHEMLHVLGIGSQWEGYFSKGVFLSSTSPLRYITKNGEIAHSLIGGVGSPYIDDGSVIGTSRSHWDERYTTNTASEIMTGYLNLGVESPISYLTLYALKDLGYQVDLNKADSFALTMSSTLRGSVADVNMPIKRVKIFENEVLDIAPHTIDSVDIINIPESVSSKKKNKYNINKI